MYRILHQHLITVSIDHKLLQCLPLFCFRIHSYFLFHDCPYGDLLLIFLMICRLVLTVKNLEMNKENQKQQRMRELRKKKNLSPGERACLMMRGQARVRNPFSDRVPNAKRTSPSIPVKKSRLESISSTSNEQWNKTIHEPSSTRTTSAYKYRAR